MKDINIIVVGLSSPERLLVTGLLSGMSLGVPVADAFHEVASLENAMSLASELKARDRVTVIITDDFRNVSRDRLLHDTIVLDMPIRDMPVDIPPPPLSLSALLPITRIEIKREARDDIQPKAQFTDSARAMPRQRLADHRKRCYDRHNIHF